MTQETNKEIIMTGYNTQKKQVEEIEKYINEKENELAKLKQAQNYSNARKDDSELFAETSATLEARKTSLETIIKNQKFRLVKMKETLLSIAKTAQEAK